MLPRKPSDGLYTYNFDLDFLLLTISNPVTSAILSQTKYHANLVLTLRQYKGALAGRTKSAEIGYLLILHSGIHAIERIDLKKLRILALESETPVYKIQCEPGNISLQYKHDDGNVRRASVTFRKRDEYERALQILLSQRLSVAVKSFEGQPVVNSSFVASIPGSRQCSTSLSRNSSNWDTSWASQARRFTSISDRVHDEYPGGIARSSVHGDSVGGHDRFPESLEGRRLLGTSPTSFSQMYPSSQLQDQHSKSPASTYDRSSSSQFHQPLRERSQGSVAGLRNARQSSYNSFLNSSQGFDSVDDISLCSSRTLRHMNDPSPLQQVSFPPDELVNVDTFNYANHPGSTIPSPDINSILPPKRTLPFKSNEGVGKPSRGKPRAPKEGPRPKQPRGATQAKEKGKGKARVSSPGPKPKSNTRTTQTRRKPAKNQSSSADVPAVTARMNVSATRLETQDSACQTDDKPFPRPVNQKAHEIPDDTQKRLWDTIGTIQEEQLKIREELERLKESVQSSQISQEKPPQCVSLGLDRRTLDIPRSDSSQTEMGFPDRPPASQLSTSTLGANLEPRRRHTREYKQWRYYYLNSCRVYETRTEKSDGEFIRRFLNEMPSPKVRAWIEAGLLHFYSSMVRTPGTRRGCNLLFTKDLTWAHVQDLATRRLKLPFPKWENF